MLFEGWKTFFEIGGIALLFLTFVFGAGALYTGTKINEQQSDKLRVFATQLTEARTALAKQQERAANAEGELLKLRDTIDKESSKTLQLQRSVTQRTVPQTGVGEKRNWDVLKPFAGVKAVISYSPQREPGSFAGNLGAIVSNAGWILDGGNNVAKKNELPDGVRIGAHAEAHGEITSSVRAAEALAAFLNSYGIADVHIFNSAEIAPNTVLIQIGQMPDPSRILE